MFSHGVILVGLGLLEGGSVLVGGWVELDDGDVILIHYLRRARDTDSDLRHGWAGRID